MINKDNNVDVSGVLTEQIKVGGWAKIVTAKSTSQREYIKAMSTLNMGLFYLQYHQVENLIFPLLLQQDALK